jgi:protein SCO1/2
LKKTTLAAVLLVLAFAAWAQDVGGDFTLTDARGRKRSLADFRGKVVVLYFGFTTCPDICPTDLLEISTAVKALGKEAKSLQPLFVTLDPARDKPALIAEYVKNFHPSFIALTGTDAEIGAVAKAYDVSYRKVPVAGPFGYTIDHTSSTYVIDRQGKYASSIPPGTPHDRIARILHAQLAAAP